MSIARKKKRRQKRVAPLPSRGNPTLLFAAFYALDIAIVKNMRNYSSSPSKPSTGVLVPNKPSDSLLIPAVKYTVFAKPAVPSFAQIRTQIPSMVMMELSGFLTKPMKLCVKPLQAAIQPLRKSPTRIELLNSPKSRVVQTTRQGALNQSPRSRCPMWVPDGVKSSTKPSPAPPTGSCRNASCFA